MQMQVKVKRLSATAVVPSFARAGDAGMDLCASADVRLAPGEWKLVPTGIAIELPAGTEAQVRPRSGLAVKHGITVLNAPGTIDEGYRGEVGVILINHGREPFDVTTGARIAQLVVMPRLSIEVVDADTLTHSERGAGGFGSSGS